MKISGQTVKGYRLPGMRIMEFAFIDDLDNIHLPHNYSANTVAYSVPMTIIRSWGDFL